MATIVKTSWHLESPHPQTGWPSTAKSFRTKRDAEDWARRTEDEMVRGVYIQRAPAERMTVEAALARYLKEVTPTKRASTQAGEHKKAQVIIRHLGKYSLAALNAEIVAQFRDTRLAGDPDKNGKLRPRSNNTVRLNWRCWATCLPSRSRNGALAALQSGVQHPPPGHFGSGRNRRLTPEEQNRLLQAVDKHSNPMFGWIVRIAVQTGMRLSEIATLRIRQVDIERRVVRLEHTKNSSPRTVPLTAEATRVFTEALANPVRPAETELVFFGEPGRDGIRRPYLFDKAWTDAKRAAGLEDFDLLPWLVRNR